MPVFHVLVGIVGTHLQRRWGHVREIILLVDSEGVNWLIGFRAPFFGRWAALIDVSRFEPAGVAARGLGGAPGLIWVAVAGFSVVTVHAGSCL